jgi:hypothetical protein
MGIPGIGIQQILPQTGTTGPASKPAPDPTDDSGDMTALAAAPAAEPARSPPAPGTGNIVDRMA